MDYLNVALERHLARLEAGCMEFLLENFDLVRMIPGLVLNVHLACSICCKCPLTIAKVRSAVGGVRII